MDSYRRDGLVFDVRDAGPSDGEVVVLLHGFPQHNDSWNAVIDRLSAHGYRALAPNQRGYSSGARPTGRRNYRMSELVADVGALIDASGADRVHLVGHDWGAAVAWGVAATMPGRLLTLTPLSVPHPAAFMKAIVSSRQALASWYMYFFQLPWLPERVLLGRNAIVAKRFLGAMGQSPEAIERDVAAMGKPGELTAGLNWYRAMPFSDVRSVSQKITVPTMFVWSDQDPALLAEGAYATGHHVGGEYRFEVIRAASHWLPEERADDVAALLIDWFSTHRAD
jgi:pimeloyl-ACP methyl ester carboxylesterase